MASTSSTPPRQINYDVFLSFRGTDTRKTFVGHLYNKLVEAGIRTFKDDEELEKGQRIEKLLQYIKESQFAIVVFSKDYASAKWCLEEIATIMECQQQYGEEIMIPIFYDVEPSVVRNQTESFAESFKRHEEENTEKVKVERWKEALKKAGQISGYHLQNDFNGDEAKCVEIVTNDIFTRVNQSIKVSSTVLDNFVGLESRLTDVGKLLTQELDDVQFIGIWGMGGIGKTTIAMVVFNKFSSQFDGACFLDDVKQHKITELQETLLGRTLNKKMGISNEVDGREKIQRWLRGKKVLIVLDDVDQVEQLEKLAGHRDWFGRGSRVIITTRDAEVLRSHGVDKKYVYEVHTLEHLKAIQLFSCYAFKSEIRATGLQRLSGLIVDYCKGLPLALKILGSSLCGLEAADWESTLEQLKDTPNDDIHGKLKISFDRLDSKNQKIFLHIACFFRHEEEKYVKDVLKSCDLHPVIGMRVLIEKSLISVVKGRIEMHDLIQDMGWHIAKAEDPRSRVWEFEEDGVLFRKMELTKHIECILFHYTTYGFWRNNYENISSAFEGLKILIGNNEEEEDGEEEEEEDNNFDNDVKDNYQLPSSLRWLHFPDYPFRSLPTSFHPDPSSMDTNPSELVGICLRNSSLENCWITKELNKLTYLDLSSSWSLLETPNFDMMPNLRSLDLSHCSNLKEIHPSVGRLEKLVLLDLSHCLQLLTLPCFVQVSSLQFLKLEGCIELRKFPEIQANMPLVLELNLERIRIREFPSSIGRLRGLTKLRLCQCNYLVSLSDDLCELKSLKILALNKCPRLKSLPEKLGNLSKLEELHIIETAIFQLPSSMTQLSSLECLRWGGSSNHRFEKEILSLEFLPSVSGLRSLKKLQLSHFRIIDEGLPFDLGQCLISLEYLNLQGSNFDYLLESFGQLPQLQYLDLRDCRELEMLPELPKTIRELYMHSHFVSGNKSINIAMFAIKYPMLYSISFSSCDDVYDKFRGETFLVKESIQFPFHRKTPFSVSYSTKGFKDHMDDRNPFLRSFQYRRFKSNRICFNLNPYWYSTQFGGFAVYFDSYHHDMWERHSYEGFDFHTRHCVFKAKLTSHNDIHEDLKTKCVIAGSSTYYNYRTICFVYVPFSSLWPESKPITEASDYSRFEVELVNLEASADWGINLLYKRRYTFPSLDGAREHMGNYHRSDSEQSNEEALLFEETPVSSYQPEPVVRNQTKSLAKLFKRHEEENTKANVEMWKEELKKDGEISGHHLRNDFNGFKAKCVEIVTHDAFSRLHYTILKDNFVGLETRVGYVGKLLTQEPDDVQFVGILGMKGIGKTTIAVVVFNKFWGQFDEAYYLVDVKEHKITELQEALLCKILKKKMEISNEVDGMKKIGELLGRKKVLIVLDDVDQVEQLQKLAGRRDWFGKGSRVIITTRDVGVLRSHGVDKKYVYKVHTLEYQKAIQLFSCYAFKSEIPATGFELLSGLIVDYCKGFPLALKVLGSSLYGLEAAEWESTLEQLKDTLDDDILGKLKISFDRLDFKNKKIFLHIACFFRLEKEKHVNEALNTLQPEFLDMRVLIEKSFISVNEYGIIEMHDLIQEMGWRIARDEKHRSRVWEFKEVDDVLCGKMDSKHIECIVFPYTCGFRWQNISNAFKVLKILIGKRSLAYNKEEDTHSNAFEVLTMNNYQFPSSLELIHFPDYPFPLLPTSLHHPSGMDDNPLELAVISSHRCSLGNSRITEKLNKLTYLNLSSSCSLLETPNFDMMPNLEKLYLSSCVKLVEIHPSVGYLKKLVLLDLSYCCYLRRLPRFIQVSSLQFLKLERCVYLRKFPEIQANMPLVLELNLEGIGIRELPSSIGRLRGLTKLGLCQCNDLVSLSDDLCELESLKILELRHCGKLKSLPEKLGNLSKLKELHIIETAIFQLPSSITQLSSLECLCWGGSSRHTFKKEISLKFLPSLSSLRSLKKLRLSGFKIIDEGLPSNLGQCLISLEYLNLMGSNFDYSLETFSRLPHLQYLDITYCDRLPQQLPATIRELYATSNFLASESNMAKLAIKYPKLYSVSFSLEHLHEEITFSAVGLARKFAHAPFQIMRNSSFIVTYPIQDCSTDRDMTEWFKYSSYHSNKISVSLKSSWFNQSFVGFVVCFILKPGDSIWKLRPDGFPFRYGEVIAQLVHKDNDQVLQTNCVIGRQYPECNVFKDTEIICFAYIPFHSLFNNELSATPSDYLVFEVGFGDAALNALTDWSCGLLYQNDESLSEAIWSKTSSHHNADSVPNGAHLWEFTKVVDQVQCQMVFMPECSDTKVVRLLYTNSGVGILALSSNGIQKLWKWPNNEQNPTGKATANSAPQHWQPNSGLVMINDVVDVNLEKVAPCIDLYKNDSYIVSAVGRKVSFFNIMTFEVMTTFRPYDTPTFLVVYPCNNNVIAIGTENGTIILYNVRVDEVKANLRGDHHKHITGLAFSTTDPSILVSSSADAKICVWDMGCGWQDKRS